MSVDVRFHVLKCRCVECDQMFDCNEQEWSPHLSHYNRVSFLSSVISHPEWSDRIIWITFLDDGTLFIEPVARA